MDTTTTAPFDGDGLDADTPPMLPFVHMWTGLDGRSRLDESIMRGFGLQSVGGGADPQWMRPFPGEVAAVLFAVLPVGWVGDWHPSPHPQWVIPLRGRWFLATQDGARVEMGPGDIHFGQDVDTAEIDGDRGHLSGTWAMNPAGRCSCSSPPPPAPRHRTRSAEHVNPALRSDTDRIDWLHAPPLDGQILQHPRSPEQVEISPPRVWDERLAAVLPSSSRLLSLYADATWAEGPVWWPEERSLVFSDVIGRRTLAWREDGSIVTVRDRSNFANGNTMDAEGRLIQAEHGRRGVSRTDADGTVLLVDSFEGEPLNSPNDLVVASDGAIWFTDPTYGISDPREGYPADPALPHQSVYRWREGESLQRMIDLDQPNGLAFSRDERTLYVAESNAAGLPRVVACSWDGTALGTPRTFATVDAGIPDGFVVDSRDWLWISSEAGVVIVDETGRRLGVIPTPHVVSNCTFDADEKRLFITGDSDLWMVQLA